MDVACRREFTRVDVDLDVEIEPVGQVPIAAKVKNISMSGLYVATPARLALGANCALTIILNRSEADRLIRATGMVMRTDWGGLGIEFSEIKGLDSFNHLCAIVLRNAPDAAIIEREFKAYFKL